MRFFKAFIYLIFYTISMISTGQNNASHTLYVGTFTSEGAEGIYVCAFHDKTGKLELVNTIKGNEDPSFLKISNDKKLLFAVSRKSGTSTLEEGLIEAYRIGKNGDLKLINTQSSNGVDPCHVDVSKNGQFVAVANYSSGTTSLYPVEVNGQIQPAATVIHNTGRGPDSTRQTKPFAHSIKFSPFSNEVFSADLGTDQLNIYNLIDGELVKSKQDFVKLAPGAGPRHFDFHPSGKFIYVISELNSTVTVLGKKAGNWQIIQTISTIPEAFEYNNYCADIHVSPDGKYLYGSNRGQNSVVTFKISKKGNLKVIGFTSTEGNWPRNFTLSPSGRYLLVANQKTGNITVFELKNGLPVFTGKSINLPSPVCLEFL